MWPNLLSTAPFAIAFLLTHPVWDVTEHEVKKEEPYHYFYSHIPCGMWPGPEERAWQEVQFLLTHPVWDVTTDTLEMRRRIQFLLTHPVWDVTIEGWARDGCTDNFYSHIPCGMWLIFSPFPSQHIYFYSHIPCGMWRGAASYNEYERYEISTHTSRVGCDPYFSHLFHGVRISTHTSRVGCDGAVGQDWGQNLYFYSHIPCGMWHFPRGHCSQQKNFYSHIPCGMWLSCSM